MQAHQIPPGGPGQFTTTPVDRELYIDGLLEVPKYGPNCPNGNCPTNNCEPGYQGGFHGEYSPANPGNPNMPVIRPQPTPITPGTNPGSGGLIAPPGMGPSVPPSPNVDNKNLSNSSAKASRPRPATTKSKVSESEESSKRSSILPAGFRKDNKKPARSTDSDSDDGK